MNKDDYEEWLQVYSSDIADHLEEFEKDFHEYFSAFPFEKRVSKTGRKMFKAYQKMQEALLLVSSAAEIFLEVELYLSEIEIDDE